MTTPDLRGYFNYWGKAGEGETYHLLPYHSIDVAQVAWVFTHTPFEWMDRLVRISGCDAGDLQAVIPLLMGLHDIGKFSDPFQGQRADIARKLQGHRALRTSQYRHDSLGWALWRAWTSRRRPYPQERDLVGSLVYFYCGEKSLPADETDPLLDSWMSAIIGHHGRPPDPQGREDIWQAFGELDDPQGLGQARRDALDFAYDLNQVFGRRDMTFHEADPELRLAAFRRSSWWLAGFAILCDWIGSNTDHFPYVSEPMPLLDYAKASRLKAWAAVQSSGLLRVPIRAPGRDVLFPHISIPTPLQKACEQVDPGVGPQLFVLEDLTGSGKTEAAVILASRLLRADKGAGLFFALPTMATANAMDGRLRGLVDLIFAKGASYLLSHSGPRLTSADRLHIGDSEAPPSDGYGREEEATASRTASAWLSDNRKKALLATMGVGTLDQALLGALQSKHAALRLFGLHSHILIVDEVHACDSYMLEILCALLRMHAGLGGSAILLSATLPIAERQRLADAFGQGLQCSVAQPTGVAYPLLTAIGTARVEEIPVAARDGASRDLPVVFHHSPEAVLERLADVARHDQCACWIRNTVTDALEAYDALVAKLGSERVTLFHARFALGDRLAIEQDVVERFGPQSTQAQRRGQVVIATQVVEQSLDLDFDVLVTDLCPIDRVIQRAGRLQRHHRTSSREAPRIEVHTPEYVESPAAGWLSGPFLRTSYVYPDPAVLWRTVGELVRRGQLSLPSMARSLVEAVFRPDGLTPEGLQQRSLAAEGKDLSSASVAKMATVDLDQGYVRVGADWASDMRTPTRLGEPTVTVRLARMDESGAEPWFAGMAPRLRWPLSQLSVRRSQLSAVPEDEATLRAPLEATQPFVGDDVLTVLVRSAGDGLWKGRALAPGRKDSLRPVQVLYSKSRGLELVKEA